jgi:hypothetical protein
MRVVVRAFNKDGYYKDIAIMSEHQVHQHDSRLTDASHSCLTGLIGHGLRIDPSELPEMAYFEIIIQYESRMR